MKRLGALSLLVCVITLLSGAFATYPIDAKDALRVFYHCPFSKKKDFYYYYGTVLTKR